MRNISLIEALSDCTTSCRWCDNHCIDEEKYDVIVYCISIQKECVEILRKVNLILSHKASNSLREITELFEILSENVQKSIKTTNISSLEFVNKPEENLKPGCSQIFLISQLLEQSFSFKT